MNLSEINTLFTAFSRLENEYVKSKIEDELIPIRQLFSDYEPVDRKLLQLLENTAPGFNIFEILHIKRYETKVHTPFLTHLLNPYESHKQQRLFFDSFMQLVLKESYQSEMVKNIDVHEEYSFSKGRIDILIYYEQNGIKKSLVIENKIDHHDEEKQLERYYHFLKDEREYGPGNFHLVYLKPYKSPPSAYSISPELYRSLKQANTLTELGYMEHIYPWLQNAFHEIKAPVVRETLTQYLKTIKSL